MIVFPNIVCAKDLVMQSCHEREVLQFHLCATNVVLCAIHVVISNVRCRCCAGDCHSAVLSLHSYNVVLIVFCLSSMFVEFADDCQAVRGASIGAGECR